MGRIAKILSTLRGTRNSAAVTDVKADPGGGAVAQGDQFNSAGDDSNPLPGDYAIFVEVPRGGFVSVGNIDPGNAQTAEPGERRIYARDTTKAQVCEVHLKNDGTVHINNGSGAMALLPSGVVDINGVTIDPEGNIETPASITTPSAVINGVEHASHGHPYSWTDPAGDSTTGGPQ